MSLMDKNNNSGVRGLADMDTRLSKLSKRIAEMEEAISKLEKVKSRSVTLSDCLGGICKFTGNFGQKERMLVCDSEIVH